MTRPVFTHSNGSTLIELPSPRSCPRCHIMHYFMWNTYGRTLCSDCISQWEETFLKEVRR